MVDQLRADPSASLAAGQLRPRAHETPVAPLAARHDHAELGERRERLAHGAAAHVELFAERPLDRQPALGSASAGDEVEQPVDHVLGQLRRRSAARPRCESCSAGSCDRGAPGSASI